MIACACLSDADRAAGRRLVSSGQLYAHPVGGDGGLFGDELRRLAAFQPGDAQSAHAVITFGGGRRDLGDRRAKLAGGLDRRQQGTDATHIAVVGDDDLHGQVDRQLHQAFGKRQFGDQLRFGRFVHHVLHGFIARLKALFRGSVE